MVAGAGTLASAAPLPAGSTAVASPAGVTMSVTVSRPPSPQGEGSTSGSTSGDVGPTRTRTGENRRSNKPIMEKRRRARINNCLNELKTLILDAMKKDPARHSKLEKADILEMTVKHLESLQRQQVAMATSTDPAVTNKYRAGFTECAGEVGRFPGLEAPVKRRLLQHLSNCLNNATPKPSSQNHNQNAGTQSSSETQTSTPLQVHILRTPDSNIIQGLQLVPTRLPNGDIALILPAARTAPVSSPSPSSVSSSSTSSSPLPMLIPIPNRTTLTSPSPSAFDRLSVTSPQRLVVTSNERQLQPQSAVSKEEGDLVIAEDYDEPQSYESDRETMLHIPERDYYDESYEESESEYYQQRPYSPDEDMPKPLSLVMRKQSDDSDDQHWRPW